MSQSSRRYPEDSVVVSIGRVRDLLRDEAPQPARDTEVRSVPQAIPVAKPGQLVEVVPSAAEVAARREARWSEDTLPHLAGPPRRALWSRHGAMVTAAAGGTALGLLLALVLSEPPEAPELEARLAQSGQTIEALEASLADARGLASEARAQAAVANAEKATLAEQLAALEAQASVEKRQKTARRTHRRGRAKAKKRRRPAKLTRNDRNLDALLDSL